MKFVLYINDSEEKVGIVIGEKVIAINEIFKVISKNVVTTMNQLIEEFDESTISEIEAAVSNNNFNYVLLDSIKLLAPIPNPKRNVFCLGKNYVDHVNEIKMTKISGTGIPEFPIYFTKVASPAIGNCDNIKFSYEVTSEVDYEVELAIVIGKEGINIKPENAEEYIFGYTIVNDVSARDLQGKHTQWFKGKGLDTFCPMGPYIVHKSEIKFPVELNIQSRINGELRQNSNTKKLIFDIPYIISDLSKGLTLKPGDIICTGTPSGVGMGFVPHKLLKNNDVIECYIENIGKLVNKVVVV
ncbi:fumarylacetoacetate hydrolase family protein [Clostridium lacusfryxellense]|uniref:fumarylacetoacetate hydrolase family protein n=1 Tax=Clostridium lacusfryxellense TaxID=205328 RepID=UPI001C0C22C9|nr:fumarylacetoacetate hydrolase family protein [Clostridium lacusfryxellense]MBU3111090.1 fumarylacetoacetate hydrolase family protein [Clostridium lacusfryxellense]